MENGHRSPADGPYYFEEEIVYTCNPGYKMKGDPVIECTNNGQFNKLVPSCGMYLEMREVKFARINCI